MTSFIGCVTSLGVGLVTGGLAGAGAYRTSMNPKNAGMSLGKSY